MKAKRILSLVLAMIMVMTAFAIVPVSAEGEHELLLNFDFNDLKNGSITATGSVANGLTVTTTNGTTAGRTEGETAMALPNGNEHFFWWADDSNPLLYSEDGITLTMWVNYESFSDGWGSVFNLGNSVGGNSNNYIRLQRCNNAVDGYPAGGVRIMTRYKDASANPVIDSGEKAINLGNAIYASDNIKKWKMVTFTEKDGYWSVYEDNKLVSTWDGKVAGAYSVYAIAQQMQKVNDERGGYSARYSLFGDQSGLWNNPGGTGAVQSVSFYAGAMTLEEVRAMYSAAVGMDQTAVNSVIELINAAKNAEVGSAAQLQAYKAAVAAYDALNAIEKEGVTNYADLEAVKNSYIANSGVILGFDFNGNYDEILGRVSFKNTNNTSVNDTALIMTGTDIGDWSKTMGFEHRTYPVFDQTTGDISIEIKVNATAYDNSAIFSFTWGENHYLKLTGLADNKLELRYRERDKAAITPIVSEEAALTTGKDQTITITQEKGETTTTTVYVDGVPAITTTAVLALADWNITSDDILMVGVSDHGSSYGSHNMFNGTIDSYYIYNYAKEFAGDYSAVEAAKAAVPDDLDVAYTEATAQAVRDAIANVTYGLTAADQAEIDAYAQAIKDALDALELKKLDLDLTISDAVVVANDEDAYNITWNANVVLGEGVTFDDINNSGATFKAYGVVYGTSEDAVAEAATAGADTNTAKIKAFAEGDDIDVYTIFGFRLKNVGEGKERAAMFYVTYEMNGHTFTIYSPVAGGETIA